MKIKHEIIQCVLLSWAAEVGQAHAANLITEKYLQLGGGSLPLERGKTWNNQQNIFHRWLNGETPKRIAKIRELLPSILLVLPGELSARLVLSNSIEYRALQMAKIAVSEAADAYVAATVVDVVNQYYGGIESPVTVLH
ncbi:toxin YdaT domain-containing protein [Citrobacter amalonaticus]|uniref:toxin YdaT domain-containing protein n=1 Tax=Citrobacter amalonaticus TaxID=35703 RepID=UPI00215C30F5|nr:toxin YdaT domain-containing protein [Citrobacter amalonaticus]MCR9028373.1 toxin YdaT domain-containing protein [Citrobacter amalonaticus]